MSNGRLSGDAKGVPRALVIAPLVVSFLALQRQLWSLEWCASGSSCRRLGELIDWIGMGFPHPAIYPLAALGTPAFTIFVLMLLVDIALAWAAVRLLPLRPRGVAAAAIWGGWLLLSVGAVFAASIALAEIWT
jgi:hypothetical protein